MKKKYSLTVYKITAAVISALVIIVIFTALATNMIKNSSSNNSKPYLVEHSVMSSRLSVADGPGAIPNDWLDRQRSYPYGKIKSESYLKAMNEASEMHSISSRNSVNWQFAGPYNIGGRITDIEVMQHESPNTILIGAASGGVFKSNDNGGSWENVFSTAATISIGDIAIDPVVSNVVWVGTGEANASSQSFRGNGIYKSVNGGETWQHSGLEESAYIGRIVVDYNNTDRVFVAACGNLFTPDGNRGIYRTDDGGLTWQRVLYVNDSVSAIDIVQHPSSPNILFASMWERMRGLNYRRSFGPGSGVYMSVDGGNTWNIVGGGLPQGNDIGRIGLAISPSNPQIIYAFYDNRYEVAVYRSDNGGISWSRTNDEVIQGMNSSFGWYFGQIRVHPSNPMIAWVLGVDLYMTLNGGNSWTQLAGYYNIDDIHVDHHAMWIDPLTSTVLEGNDGGLYTSDNLGVSWTKINNLPLTQFYDIEVDNLKPERIYGGTQDNNTVRTATGNLNDWNAILGGDGFYCLVDYTNSNIVYAEYQWGALHKSTNAGSSMFPINNYWSSDRVNWSAPVIMHPQTPTTLYFGTYRVWKSTNGGNSWSPVSGDLTKGDDGSTFHTISTLSISTIDPSIVVAGSDDGLVHISTNSGATWTNISAGLPDRWITRVANDPFDANTIYATCSGFRWDEAVPHVYKSTNLGSTWQPIDGNLPDLPVNAFIADPSRPDRYFVGTDAGVFYTNNGGIEWNSLNGTLGNVPVTAMKIHKQQNFILIGTYGLGAYKLNIEDLNVNASKSDKPLPSFTITNCFPNPYYKNQLAMILVEVNSLQVQKADFDVINTFGQTVISKKGVMLKHGLNTISFSNTELSKIPEGMYIINVRCGKTSSATKVLITR